MIKKIRDIGAAYLQELRVVEGQPHVEDEAAQLTVNQLLARLERLDFRTGQDAAGAVNCTPTSRSWSR